MINPAVTHPLPCTAIPLWVARKGDGGTFLAGWLAATVMQHGIQRRVFGLCQPAVRPPINEVMK